MTSSGNSDGGTQWGGILFGLLVIACWLLLAYNTLPEYQAPPSSPGEATQWNAAR